MCIRMLGWPYLNTWSYGMSHRDLNPCTEGYMHAFLSDAHLRTVWIFLLDLAEYRVGIEPVGLSSLHLPRVYPNPFGLHKEKEIHVDFFFFPQGSSWEVFA